MSKKKEAAKRVMDLVSTKIQHKPNLPKPSDLIKKWNIIRGDEVMIMDGKEKGEVGKVLSVLRDRNKLLITGKNLAWKHVPKADDNPGGKVRKEMPIHYSNVMLLDPNTRKPCKIDIRKVLDEKTGKMKNQRFVSGTDTIIVRPKFTEYMADRADGPYDTLPEAVAKHTYTPTLKFYPLPAGVIDELRSPFRAYKHLKSELRKIELKKEGLEIKLAKRSRSKYPGFVPGGTKPRAISSPI